MQMNDPIAGDLSYDDFWHRSERVVLFGVEHVVILRFQGNGDEGLDEGQRQAFAAFELHRAELLSAAETAIFAYYNRIAPEYRSMFGEEAGLRMPAINSIPELARMVTPTHLWFPWSVSEAERVFGLLCDCSWEPGLGLAVKFVNEEVKDVGTQDIVL